MNSDRWFEIGEIVAAQGLRGEVRVYPDSDFPERFEKPGKRWLQNPATGDIQEVELVKGRFISGKGIYVVRFAEASDRSSAEALRGLKILVPADDLPQLEADEYHVSDLIGLEVFHVQTGEKIGVVVDLFSFGNDTLEVKLSASDEAASVLIPFVKEIVPVVDLENHRLEVDPPEGLLDLR